MKEKKVRLDNELVELFSNLPKSTNTAMSWLLLHKTMKESLSSGVNLINFNLLDFVEDYNLSFERKDNLKNELIRDFKKLKNSVETTYVNDYGNKSLKTYYFFQETDLDLETLEVKVKLNEDIYNSVSSIPEKNYFQFLKQEVILIANKKISPIDMKLLIFLKSKSHNQKLSFVKIDINDLYSVLGQSKGIRFAVIKKRHLDPFIQRILENTNYVISYEVQKNKLNKRTNESILFTVDNRKEKVKMINKLMDQDTIYSNKKAQEELKYLEPEFENMLNFEERVNNKIISRIKKSSINNKSEIMEINKEELLNEIDTDEKNQFDKTIKLEINNFDYILDDFDF